MTILNLDEEVYRVIAPGQDDLQAEITISEDHDDELMITEHPVEFGAIMSDHAYKRPPEVRVRVGWSNASGGYSTYAQDIYKIILALQLRRQLFDLRTGKRYYKNMLVAGVHTLTDQQSEYAFLADVSFRQVFLSQTRTTQVTGLSSNSNNHSDPTSTGQTQDSGRQQLVSSNTDLGQETTDQNTPESTITNSNDGGSTNMAPTFLE
jgi:Dit-like tail protein